MLDEGVKSELTWKKAELASSIASGIKSMSELGKLAGLQIRKNIWIGIFKVIGIGIAVADALLDLAKSVRNFRDGRFGLGTGYLICMLSGICITWGVIAMSASLGIVGLLLAVLGAAIIYYFTESDFEKWAKNSCWGREGAKSVSLQDLESQILQLNGILTRFRADVFIHPVKIADYIGGPRGAYSEYKYSLALRIKTGLYIEGMSKFHVNLNVKDLNRPIFSSDDVEIVSTPKLLVIPGADSIRLGADANDQEIIFLQFWELNDPRVVYKAKDGRYEFDLKVKLDLHGDGKYIFPHPTLEKPFSRDGKAQINFSLKG